MKHILVAIHDSAAQAYMQPWSAPTPQYAIRAFINAVQDPQGDIRRHPEDYELRVLAEFDNETGAVQPMHTTTLARAKDHIQPEQTQ